MTTKRNFKVLLDNFRFSEALGYISALVDSEKISAKRGEMCQKFICAYKQVVRDSLWNEEGMHILSANRSEDKDVEDERKRLICLMEEWLKDKKLPLLYFVSAYYAVSNVDGLRMKFNLEEIMNMIKDDDLTDRVSNALGGYEKFQLVGSALENYCHLDGSIFEFIKNFTINLQL